MRAFAAIFLTGCIGTASSVTYSFAFRIDGWTTGKSGVAASTSSWIIR